MTSIKDNFHASMTLTETKKLILQSLKNVMEEKICTDNVEVIEISTASKKLRNLESSELQEIIDQLA